MANRHKGEIELTAGDKSYTLVFNTHAMTVVEQTFSTPDREITYDEIMARVQKGSVRHIVGLMYAMASTHHPQMTYAAMERVIDDAGGIGAISEIVRKALIELNPDAEDLDALGIKPEDVKARANKARPPQAGRAARGTTASTAKPDAPASAATSTGH